MKPAAILCSEPAIMSDTQSTLVNSSYNPSRGGHAPGDLREAFQVGIEHLASWRPGDPEPSLEVRDQQVPFTRLAGLLWNCTEILPAGDYKILDMPVGSTNAQAGREVKARFPTA
jgi:hypothetical protein